MPNGISISWNAAQACAEEHGGYLATIGSEAENQFVFHLADDARYWWTNSGGYTNGPFLGGKKMPSGPGQEVWQWVNEEGPFTYTNWAPSQPDNKSGGTENRLSFYSGRNTGLRLPTWNDCPSDNSSGRSFVIEYKDASRALLAKPPAAAEAEQQDNPRVRSMFERYQTGLAIAGGKASNYDAAGKVRELMQSATSYAQDELRGFSLSTYYDFFRSNHYSDISVPEQVKFREALIKVFKSIEADARSFQLRTK